MFYHQLWQQYNRTAVVLRRVPGLQPAFDSKGSGACSSTVELTSTRFLLVLLLLTAAVVCLAAAAAADNNKKDAKLGKEIPGSRYDSLLLLLYRTAVVLVAQDDTCWNAAAGNARTDYRTYDRHR